MARKRHRNKKAYGRPVIQLTPEQTYKRWEAMHSHGLEALSPLNAFQQSVWAYSAITLIAETCGLTPFVPMRDDREIDHPIRRFLDKPNEYGDQDTSSKLRYAWFVELLLNGSVMRLLGRMAGFVPGTMSIRPRWQFRANETIDDLGRRVPAKWDLIHNRTNLSFIPGDTIYHDALYHPLHDYEGMAPLTAALINAATDRDLNEFASRFFRNDGSTGVVFTTDHPAFNQSRADEAAESWKQMHSGLARAFLARFVGFGLKPHVMGTPLDARMIQILKSMTKEEIVSGIFKIPLDAVSAKESGGDIVIGGPSGGTQASAREGFLINVAIPWAKRHDEEFNRDVTWRFDASIECRHDFSRNPILERRRLERATAAVQLIDRGVPLNEVIRWLRLEIQTQPHGNDFWVEKDRLPARVVMNAGDDAIKIAIPDPTTRQREQSVDEHVGQIVRLAATRQFAELTRSDPAVRIASNGKSNHDRIAELIGPGVPERLHLGFPGGSHGHGSHGPAGGIFRNEWRLTNE